MAAVTLVNRTLFTCRLADQYHPNRNLDSVFKALVSEVGETAVEIDIANGQSYKAPGPDGVVGEAVDAILAALDLIYKAQPNITEEEILRIAQPKLDKWIYKIAERQQKLLSR